MSNKEQVLSRCKSVVDSGGKCPESGVCVYEQESNDGTFYELCYDGAKLYINADGTGEGFEAAAKWLKLDNPWRLTSEELPPWGHGLIGYWKDANGYKSVKFCMLFKDGEYASSSPHVDDGVYPIPLMWKFADELPE